MEFKDFRDVYWSLFNTPSACGGVSASSLSLRERVRVRGNIIG
jgi:hypothetical protein